MNTSARLYLLVSTISLFGHGLAFSLPDAPASAPAPVYLACTRVNVVPPAGKDALEFLRAQLPKNDRSVSAVPFPDTDLFEIRVTAPDPKTAARRANEITRAIQSAARSDGSGAKIKIWEAAQPPAAPVARTEAK